MSLQLTRVRRALELALTVVVIAGGAVRAEAHILLVDPKPRDQIDTHKNDAMPCPPRTASQPVTMYKSGATITVKFNETTNHPGCFGVDLSLAGDKDWMLLGTVPHASTNVRPRPYSTMVTLPAGMSCASCTLRVRQFMLKEDPPTCPPSQITPGTTYYQCANVVIAGEGGGGQPDAGAPPRDSGGGGGSGGATGGSGGGEGGSGGASGGSGGSTPTGGSGGSTPTGGSGGGSTGSGGKAGGGGSSTGGAAGEDTGGEGGSGEGGKKPPASGCAVGGDATSGGWLLLASIAVVLGMRRRRR